MTKCALIADVIVGELSLLESTSIAKYAKTPLCPVVGIQISNGPLLHIPFLTPESIKSHLQYVSEGHQFLPLEVEESYLNGGKFSFQRGKSCLYTIPCESLLNNRVEDGVRSGFNVFMSSQRITVVVMNALQFPPAFFGKSTLQLLAQNETEGSVTGKVQLQNHKGIVVGYLTIAITLRNLGEEVAFHTKSVVNVTGEDLYGKDLFAVGTSYKNDQKTIEAKKSSHEKPELNKIDLTSQKTNFNHSKSTVSSDIYEHGLEQSYIFSGSLDDHLQDEEFRPESSEEIALRIAELLRNEDSQDGIVNTVNMKTSKDTEDNFKQPSPIFYNGHDSEIEKLWNKKMQDFGIFSEIAGYSNNLDEEPNQRVDKESESVTSPKNSSVLSQGNVENTCKYCSQETSKEPDLRADGNQQRVQRNQRWQTLKTPKGWLRSAPVASCNMLNKNIHPKLTRTTLLRRAKLDPQLAHQLNAEVNYQIKQKLQILERNFNDEMLDIKKRKQMKNNKGSIAVSVGCQAGDYIKESRIPQFTRDLRRDFTQQTILSQTINQSTQISKDLPKDISLHGSERGSYLLAARNDEKSLSRLEKNRTFDIDVGAFTQNDMPKYDDDFEVSSAGNSDLESVSVSLLYQDSHSNGDASVCSQQSSHAKEKISYSSSVMKSKPKSYSKDQKATNRTRDDMMKISKSDSRTASSERSSAESDTLKRDPQSLVNHGYASSSRLTSEISQKSTKNKKITVPYADNLSSHRSISEVDDLNEIVSSEATVISEASNLSKEIYQEIMKGRKADVLLRNGSQIHDTVKEESIVEELTNSSASSVPLSKDGQRKIMSDSVSGIKSKFIRAGETFSIGEIIHSDDDEQIVHSDNSYKEDLSLKEYGEISQDSQTKQRRNIYKQMQNRVLYKTYTKSEPSYISPSKDDEIPGNPISQNSSIAMTSSKDADDVDSSISNISARIAALLMPKQLQMASLHTDSISSYIPSNVSDTLSSLSDME